jgi:hypothetical protein
MRSKGYCGSSAAIRVHDCRLYIGAARTDCWVEIDDDLIAEIVVPADRNRRIQSLAYDGAREQQG